MEFPNIRGFDAIAIDVETTGLKWYKDEIFGIAISTPEDDYYWDVRRTPQVIDWLKDEMAYVGHITNQNIKFDKHMLENEGIILPANISCTMMRAALINEHLHAYNLDFLAKKYLGKGKHGDIYKDLAAMFGGQAIRGAQMKNLHMAPVDMVAPYAKVDTRRALQLWHWQQDEIARQGLSSVLELEERLAPHIYDMERRGIRVDVAIAEQQLDIINSQVTQIRREIDRMAGFPVNPNPSKSIHKLFAPKEQKDGSWVAIDGTPLETTGAGCASINATALKKMKHPVAGLILKCRKLMKMRDTFISGHIIGHEHNGRVHANINQTKSDTGAGEEFGTGTGRLSYNDPALQQIPSRDKEMAALIRPIFLPDEGQKWSYGDLDQHEYRIFAHYVNNPRIIEAYRENPNLDFHQNVADLTGLPRSAPTSGGPNAKQLNLGMVFCMGAGHMADIVGLPWTWDEFKDERGKIVRFQRAGEEAIELMERYHSQVPGIREIAKKAKVIAKTRGYIKTIKGRHIRFPGGFNCRKASGLLYQGTAGDLNKENICRIAEYLRDEAPESRLLLNIHDEYSMSMAIDGNENKHLKECQRLIQDRPEIRVPIRIDFSKPSDNWWEATKAEICT